MVEKLFKAIAVICLSGISVCVVLAMIKELASFGIIGAIAILIIGATIWRLASRIKP